MNASQDTDVATEIRNFTGTVFDLKGQWEQALISLKALNVPASYKVDLDKPYESYQKFIRAAQSAANDARTGALSTFQEIVLGSALEPSLSIIEKREEAVNAIQMIRPNPRSAWTQTDTAAISAALDQATQGLKAYAQSLSAGASAGDDEISTALARAAALTEEHLALQDQISAALQEESRVDKKLHSILNVLLLVIALAPQSIGRTLTRWLGSDSLSLSKVDALVKRDEKVQADLLVANLAVKRLQAAQKKTTGDCAAVEALLETTAQLSTGFKGIAPRLAQVCVITDNVKQTIGSWVAFLDSRDAQSPAQLQARIADLQVASGMYAPIGVALADFVGRQT